MRGRTAELVLHESARPIFHEPVTFRPDHAALAIRRSQVELLKVAKASHTVIDRACLNDLNHAILQGLSACHDDPDADRAFAMEPLKILKVAIEERILVVPLDFQGNGALVGSTHMVDFMRDRGPLNIVDSLPDNDIAFDPLLFRQGSSEPLRRFSFSSPTPYQLRIGDLEIQQYTTQLSKRLSEIAGENGRCVVHRPNIEPCPFEIGEAQGDAVAEWLL